MTKGFPRAADVGLSSRKTTLDEYAFMTDQLDLDAEPCDGSPPGPGPHSAQTEQILARVRADHKSGAIQVPSMPQIAIKLRRLAADPAVDVGKLAEVLELEPAVAGRLLAAANSALMRGRVEIVSVRTAIVRLGLRHTCALATALSLKALLKTANHDLAQVGHDLWQRNIRLAATARVIGEQVRARGTDLDVEKAFLVALLHDLGELTLINYVDQIDPLATRRTLEVVSRALGRYVSVLVIERWGLDADFYAAAELAGKWHHEPAEPSPYLDIVNVARHQYAVSHAEGAGLPPVQEIAAYKSLKLGTVDEETGMLDCLLGNLRIDAVEQQLL